VSYWRRSASFVRSRVEMVEYKCAGRAEDLVYRDGTDGQIFQEELIACERIESHR